jgi:hypothetical protein
VYRDGYALQDTPSSIWINVSLDIGDFAPERIICLASALRKRYADRKQITVVMFSSYEAAKKFRTPYNPDSLKPGPNWSLENHGLYSNDADKREESVTIMPLGQSRQFSTRIDLPASSAPECVLQLAKRCLLAADRAEYPWAVLKSHDSGSVALEAVVERDGRVTQVRAVGQGADLSAARRGLIDAANRNLRSWRFETGRQPESIQIAFAYTIAKDETPGKTSVQYDLPRSVQIRATPPE